MATEHTAQPSFEKSLEADIQQLAQEIRDQRDRPELTNAGEGEMVKEAIRAFPSLEKKPAAAPAPQNVSSDSPLPGYAQNASATTKLEIEYLLDIALKK